MPMTMFWKCIYYTYLLWLLLCGVLTERKSALLHCSDTVVKKKFKAVMPMANAKHFGVRRVKKIQKTLYTLYCRGNCTGSNRDPLCFVQYYENKPEEISSIISLY